MGRHCKRSKQWGKLIFILLYMHGDLHSCLIPSTSASSLLVLEKKGWSWEGGCRSEIWHLHTILHLEFHWCAAKVILALWRCMVNRFPTNVKARAFFLNSEKLRILVPLVLTFSKFLIESYVQEHWLSCDFRENLCCQTVPFIVCMVHTTYQTPQQ